MESSHRSSQEKQLRSRPMLIAVFAFGVALAVGLALVFTKEGERMAEQRRVVTEIAAGAADALWHRLSHSLSATSALASIIRQQGKIDDFPALAAEMINTYGGIRNLQLQPNGIVRQIYPLAGNEKAIGHNLLQDPKRRTEALAAIESKEMTLAGPFTLIQGGVAVIGRLPVFLPKETGEERFWGFTAVLIHLNDLLETANLDRLITGGYGFEIFRINPDTGKKHVFAHSLSAPGQTGEVNILEPVHHLIEVPNAEWTLAVAPIDGWGMGRPFGQEIGLIVAVSFGLAWLVFAQLKKSDALAREIELRAHEMNQRRQVESALRESEQKYRMLFENAPLGIGLTSLDGQILNSNNTLLKMTGYQREELNKINVKSTYYEPEHRGLILKQLEREGLVYDFETVLKRKDGSLFDASLTITKLSLDGNDVLLTVIDDITELKHALANFKASEKQLRSFNAQLQSAREAERKEIAREIHDELGQALTALKMDSSWIQKSLPKNNKLLIEKMRSIIKLTDISIQTVKRISTHLRPMLLDEFGIIAALEWQVDEFETRTGVKCQMTIAPEELPVEKDYAITLFRIFQEALTNIARHANATEVIVNITEKEDNLMLEISDDGIGISEKQIEDSHSFGIIGMRERARNVDGEFEVRCDHNEGTLIKVKIPINRKDNFLDKSTHRR